MKNRRQFVRWSSIHLGTAALAGTFVGGIAGCPSSDSTNEPQDTSSSRSATVPLRILAVGEWDVELLATEWESLGAPRPEIKSIPASRGQAPNLPDLLKAAANCDIVLAPNLLTADFCLDPRSVLELGGELKDSRQLWLPSIESALATYGDQVIGIPVGAHSLVTVSREELKPNPNWTQWSTQAMELSSKPERIALPLGKGWAAWTYLLALPRNWNGWLFENVGFEPQLGTESVEVLESIVSIVKKGVSWDLGPREIYRKLSDDQLDIGVAIPLDDDQSFVLQSLPGESKSKVGLIDPFAIVGMMSQGCRQTAAATRFLLWISGGEGSESIRDRMDEASVVRAETGSLDAYESLLVDRTSSSRVLPTFRIHEGWNYYAELDEAVRKAISGDLSAAQAVDQVQSLWGKRTERLGSDIQLRAWRRNQGLRA